MTFELLGKIMRKHNIPTNVHLLSDSGWEGDETEMDGIFFNKEKNELVFTQGYETYLRRYTTEKGWLHIWSNRNNEQDLKGE
jgi:hypothetical protein